MSVFDRTKIAKIQKELISLDLPALVCFKPQNTFYISGFNPVLYSHPVITIVPAVGEPELLVHALRDDHARSAFPGGLHLYGTWGDKVPLGTTWWAALKTLLSRLPSTDRVGADLDFMPSAVAAELSSWFRNGLVDASSMMSRVRTVKTEQELDHLRLASWLTDEALDAARGVLVERGSEREVTVAASHAMHRAWASAADDWEIADFGNPEGGVHSGLGAYCLIGDRISRNADNSTSRRPREGELAMVFTFGVCEGMHAEQERCFAVGPVAGEARSAYDTFLEARELAFAAVRPGVPLGEIYESAAKGYRSRNYEHLLPGRIGHSVGLGLHEEPSISRGSQVLLEPGMALTIEPGIRVPALRGAGGQHSDTIVITDNGFEMLTSHERGFLSV